MRVLRIFPALFVLIALMTFLGCGGAGDLSGTLSLTVTAPADSTQPGSAVASYKAADGKNPVGVEVSFSTDSNIVALDSTKQTVGTDGTATVTFRVLPVPTDTS